MHLNSHFFPSGVTQRLIYVNQKQRLCRRGQVLKGREKSVHLRTHRIPGFIIYRLEHITELFALAQSRPGYYEPASVIIDLAALVTLINPGSNKMILR